MDACHVLLERLCKYDKHTLHDNYTNTYTPKNNMKPIMLFPYMHSKIRKKVKIERTCKTKG